MNSTDHISSHAALDKNSRFQKAKKIAALLSEMIDIKNKVMLDIGTGSGYIAHYLANEVGPRGKVYSIDVEDKRQIHNGYEFKQVKGTLLPFENESIDIIISNHVIEHVGDKALQLEHLKEIYRVLKPLGCVYLAVPNKWTLIEPHFKLFFLSWLPHCLAHRYVKLMNKGNIYDCYPPSHIQITQLFKNANFMWHQYTFKALKIIPSLENIHVLFSIVLKLPISILKLFYPLIPSMIFLLRKD
ncbi:MAG: class I SAM-dependent methyltransferase [Methylobacter sp.]